MVPGRVQQIHVILVISNAQDFVDTTVGIVDKPQKKIKTQRA